MTELLGKIVVIKRNGADGAHFPLRSRECRFGRWELWQLIRRQRLILLWILCRRVRFIIFKSVKLIANSSCRNNDCDIRIQLPNVSKEHAKISVDDNKKVKADFCFFEIMWPYFVQISEEKKELSHISCLETAEYFVYVSRTSTKRPFQTIW